MRQAALPIKLLPPYSQSFCRTCPHFSPQLATSRSAETTTADFSAQWAADRPANGWIVREAPEGKKSVRSKLKKARKVNGHPAGDIRPCDARRHLCSRRPFVEATKCYLSFRIQYRRRS